MRFWHVDYLRMSALNSFAKFRIFAILSFLCLLMAGCETPITSGPPLVEGNGAPERVELREGDALKITFTGAPQLDSSQQIRRDGKIALTGFGEIQAAGLTPAELEKQIIEKFGKDL